MPSVTLQQLILHNIFFLELLTRIGMSLFFGFCVFFDAVILNLKDNANKWVKLLCFVSRIFFFFGTISILVNCIVQYILPSSSFAAQIYTICSLIFSICVLYLPSKNKDFTAISFVISALIFLFMTLHSFLENKVLMSGYNNYWMLNFHIATSIVAESILVVSFCASLLFLINHNRLKKKKLPSNFKSTSLSTLDSIAFRSSFFGLALMTIALISGIIVVFVSKNNTQVSAVKIFWSFFVWGWYVLIVWGRDFWGWKGRKGAIMTMTGSLLLLLGLFENLYHYL